jgi:ubiquitin-activating enzyme E1
MEAMTKLIKLEVLIIGMRGLGVEVAKNLILAGPKSVTISDDKDVKIEDLSANFYLREEHVGNISRGDACAPQLAELNPNVVVSSVNSLNDLSKYSVVVITEKFGKTEEIMEINE